MKDFKIIEYTSPEVDLVFWGVNKLEELIDIQKLYKLLDLISTQDFWNKQSYDFIHLKSGDIVRLIEEIDLTYINSGLFSIVFLFQGQIIKVRNRFFTSTELPASPSLYLDELIRMNTLRTELSATLEQLGVFIPKYYMGTVDLIMREYIEGSILETQEAVRVLAEIEKTLEEWLQRKKEADPKWANVELDLRDKLGNPAGKNFVKTSDGKIYIIDPFYG